MSRATPVPISSLCAGTFFRRKGNDDSLYYVTKIKSNKKPAIRKMLSSEVRWLREETAYGVNHSEFSGPDYLVVSLTKQEVFTWHKKRFERRTSEMLWQECRQALSVLGSKAIQPAFDRLKQSGARPSVGDYYSKQLFKALSAGPDGVEKESAMLLREIAEEDALNRALIEFWQTLEAELKRMGAPEDVVDQINEYLQRINGSYLIAHQDQIYAQCIEFARRCSTGEEVKA